MLFDRKNRYNELELVNINLITKSHLKISIQDSRNYYTLQSGLGLRNSIVVASTASKGGFNCIRANSILSRGGYFLGLVIPPRPAVCEKLYKKIYHRSAINTFHSLFQTDRKIPTTYDGVRQRRTL